MSTQGVVSWTCDPVQGRGSISTPGVYSAAIPLGKGLTLSSLLGMRGDLIQNCDKME